MASLEVAEHTKRWRGASGFWQPSRCELWSPYGLSEREPPIDNVESVMVSRAKSSTT